MGVDALENWRWFWQRGCGWFDYILKNSNNVRADLRSVLPADDGGGGPVPVPEPAGPQALEIADFQGGGEQSLPQDLPQGADSAVPDGRALLLRDVAGRTHLRIAEEQAEKQDVVRSRQTWRDAELRKSTLSYQILKIQRNKYINFLVIFTFLITVAFFWVKERRFELEEKYKDQLAAFERLHPDLAASDD